MRTRISHTIGWRCLTATALLLSLNQAATAGAEESPRESNVPPEGFTALFNGKDFTAWRVSPKAKEMWSIEDGVLKSPGLIETYDAGLMTKKRYRDFVLLVDFRMPTISDSGIIFRDLIPYYHPLRGGQKEQFNLRSTAGFGELESFFFMSQETRDKNNFDKTRDPKIRHIEPEVGVWHTVKITMIGRTFSAEYDGELLYDRFEYPEWLLSTEPSPILLQKHAVVRRQGLGAENPCPIEFRNVFIKEIEPDGGKTHDSSSAELLARIDKTELPTEYDPAKHQEYVDRVFAKLRPEQSTRIVQLWNEKQKIDPNMPNRGFSFVKIMTYVAKGETLPAVNNHERPESDTDVTAKSGVGVAPEQKASNPVNGWKWTAETDADDANRKAIPFKIPEGPTIHVVSFAVSEGAKPPVVLLPESRLSVTARVATAHPVYFGVTIKHPNGDFAGRFLTVLPADKFRDGEDFDVTLDSRDFKLDSSLAGMKDKLPNEPFHFVIESFWFTTLEQRAGLEIAEVELTPPSETTSSKSNDGDDLGKEDSTPIANLLAGIDATDLPEGYEPAKHQQYVDRRMAELSDERQGMVGQLWKEKERLDPDMPNRGHSFVKVLEYVVSEGSRTVEDGDVDARPSMRSEKTDLPPLAKVEDNNWPQFGGPDGNGVCNSANPPRSWSETENILWKTPIHDVGWSSPVIWGDQIWVTTATPALTADHRLRNKDGGLIPRAPTTAKSFFAVCVDRDSGAVTHDVKVFDVAAPDTIAPENSYASPTPVIEEGRVYVHYGTYGTACLDTKTGEVLWTRRDLNCDHEMGPGASPILYGDLLIFTVDGCDVQYVIALDKRTGKTAWKTDRTVDLSNFPYGRRKGYCTPTVYRAGGRPEMITTAALALYAHDPQNGAELWKLRIRGNSMVPRPVYYEGLLYVVIDHEFPEICAIKPGGSGELDDSAIVWSVRKSAPRTPSYVLVDGTVLWVTDIGIAVSVDAKSGEVIWRQRVGGNYSASLISAGGRAYFFNQDATATVIEPGREYKQLATNRLDGEMHASPAVSGNSLFVRTKTHLYRIEE